MPGFENSITFDEHFWDYPSWTDGPIVIDQTSYQVRNYINAARQMRVLKEVGEESIKPLLIRKNKDALVPFETEYSFISFNRAPSEEQISQYSALTPEESITIFGDAPGIIIGRNVAKVINFNGLGELIPEKEYTAHLLAESHGLNNDMNSAKLKIDPSDENIDSIRVSSNFTPTFGPKGFILAGTTPINEISN